MELGTDVTALFDCYQADLMQRKNEAMKQFDNGVNLIQGTIAGMAANKVPDDNEPFQRVKQSLADLIAKRDEFAKVIEEKFIQLGKQQQTFFEKLVGGAA